MPSSECLKFSSFDKMRSSYFVIVFMMIYFCFMIPTRCKDLECQKKPLAEDCCLVSSRLPPAAIHLLLSSNEVKDHNIIKCAEATGVPMEYLPDCIAECAFKKHGLLTQRKELNRGVISLMGKGLFGRDVTWKDLASSAVNQCLTSASKQVQNNATCKSGAAQYLLCFKRILFLDCPSSAWSNSEKCIEEKSRLKRCPETEPKFQLKKA